MRSVSTAWQNLVYSISVARQFLPGITMNMLDVNARSTCTYTASSVASICNLPQLYDGVLASDNKFSGAELNAFLLDGTAEYILAPTTKQVGWISENRCDASCNFANEWLQCSYSAPVTTIGRTLIFDGNAISYPVDFDLIFYNGATVLYTEQVRGNTTYFHTLYQGVTSYDKLLIKVYKMNLPYTRARIIEDVPGLSITYDQDDIIHLEYLTSIDIFSEDITAAELDVIIRNDSGYFSILNGVGKESFLQRKQAMQVNITMGYPGGGLESLNIGTFYLYSWDEGSDNISASFVARDTTDRLYSTTYFKGVYSASPITMYALAQAVLIDAGVTDYTIDAALSTMYTNGLTTNVTHKEALRLIAQATASVVIPSVTGGIQIKYIGIPGTWYAPVDTLGNTIFLKTPKKTRLDSISKASVSIYNHVLAGATSNVYSGTRQINGTVTFTVDYTTVASGCSAVVTGGSVISSTFYANSAVFTINTGSLTTVTINITGYAITDNVSQFVIDGTTDSTLVSTAQAISVDNVLITSTAQAQLIAQFVCYWKKRTLQYDFDWRGNPAVECLDPVTLQDAFSVNNVAVIIRNDLSINNGVLSETSRAIY